MDFRTEDQMTRTWNLHNEPAQSPLAVMQVSVLMNYRTFRDYFFYVNRKRVIPWVNWGLVFAAAPIYELFLGIRYIISQQTTPWRFWLLLGLIIAGWIYLLLEPRIAFRQGNLDGNKWDNVGYTYIFSEDMLECIREGASGPGELLAYSSVQRAQETKAAFYLHTPDGSCLILPKNGIAVEDIITLQVLFRRKLGERFVGK